MRKKIGIYKPHFVTHFDGNDDSSVLINPEVESLVRVLSLQHDVRMLSPFVQDDKRFPRSGIGEKDFDALILVNGKLYIKEDDDHTTKIRVVREIDEIKRIFNNQQPQYQFVTDLKIVERNGIALEGVDLKEVSQSKRVGTYGELEKLFLFDTQEQQDNVRDVIAKKDLGLVYCGNERGGSRNDLVKSYLLSQEIPIKIYGKWEDLEVVLSPNFRGPIDFSKVPQLLKRALYGLCISDLSYRKNSFVTPRYFEYTTQDVVAFCDESYDKDELLISSGNFRVVKSPQELVDKIRFLEENPHYHERFLQEQRNEITPQMRSGKYQLQKLNEVLGFN